MANEKRKAGCYGLYKRNFPASVRDRVDIDYINKLSPEEKRWLARFMDEHVNGDFSHADPIITDLATRRQIYKEKNAANKDVWGRDIRSEQEQGVRPPRRQSGARAEEDDHAERASVFEAAVPPRPDESPAVAVDPYLDSPEYKAARDAFRTTLPNNHRHNPKDTPAHRSALSKLRKAGGR